MAKCESCPAADGPCRAEVDARFRYYCRMAAAGDPSQIAAIRSAAGPPSQRREFQSPPHGRPRLTPNTHMVLVQLARDCPEAGPPSCGCERLRWCARNRKNVSPSECFACLKG